MSIKNQCQLITYADSLGNNLNELNWVLQKYFKNSIGGVHILPFYPSSADRGFSPMTYDTVDSEFGDWSNVENIAQNFDLVVDFMVNHISRKSEFFKDYEEKGSHSQYADMFLSLNKFSPTGELSQADLSKIYTRKDRPPYLEIQRADGATEKVWCTFDYEQIDVDIDSPLTKKIFRNFIISLCNHGAKVIRIDAFAYVTKELGTNCFFLEPKVWEILDWINQYTSAFDVEILPEIHEHYSIQKKISEKGFWAYDFALPLLCLHGIFTHDSKNLKNWLKISPRKQFTTLDTHDGIGVVDVADLLDPEEVSTTVETLYLKGGNPHKIYLNNSDYEILDIYQINCTYYSALGCDDDAYITARTIQMFTPGIPQVYYVGLLAGKNDIELLESTKVGRNINRHYFSLEEIEQETQRPVVQRLLKLMEFRNNCSAFDGDLQVLDSAKNILNLVWTGPKATATAWINLETYQSTIEYTDQNGDLLKFVP